MVYLFSFWLNDENELGLLLSKQTVKNNSDFFLPIKNIITHAHTLKIEDIFYNSWIVDVSK